MEEKKQKPTYEQLESVCKQLSTQSEKLVQKLEEANLYNFFKRMEFLMQIANSPNIDRFSEEFLKEIFGEIETVMHRPEEKQDGDR